MNAEELLVELRNIIKRFEEEYQDAVAKTAQARANLDATNGKLKLANDLLEERKTEVAAALLSLDAELSTMRDAIKVAQSEKTDLVDSSAKLKIDNARLSEENRKYSEYESQANRVLDARDKSLVARAEEIAQTEQLLANRASFLSKRD